MGTQILEKKVHKDSKKLLGALIEEGRASSTLQLERLAVKGYEQVIKVTDKKAGLTAIIALHDLTLGPALGGIRIQPYATFDAALEDVLRLAKGMTYKSAVAEVGFGGGKSVIIADPKKHKTPEMLLAFGTAVQQLSGIYICAEDAGCTTEDVKIVRRATQYVVGLEHSKSSGDPGPFTAWGTFRGIQATLKKLFGSDSLEGRVVAIQGLGSVGMRLAEFCFWAGAHLLLSDINPVVLEKTAAKYGAKMVPADQILFAECDILAPCALGGILHDQTISKLRCKGIAGCANNQLLKDSHADLLREKGILYAPDFVINAGGLLNVAAELEDEGYVPPYPRSKAHRIYDTLTAIYEIAEKNQESTHAAALALADYRIKYGIGKRVIPPTFHHSADNS
ncbi:MAG TPA: Glu/Leu/Phe/Val dehydrogenase dimerization domain-containing protein [Chlamydiales bacterium]|jgi:leucine dehydrogenase|nr:Glu/Leu/Phe/Val dehydrogenase dimerization domain-containing protein [Chlamydiales bacterium]